MSSAGPRDLRNPHDALFRRTFSQVEYAAAELRAVLPRELVERLDLATLTLEPGSYIDHELASSESDLLFSAVFGRGKGFVYLLFEHQSSVDELMALRLLKYVVRILDRHVLGLGGGAAALPLPIVIPIVLHHSATGWHASTRLEALFDSSLMAEAAVAIHVPRFEFVLDDISHLTDDDLVGRALGILPTLALWALRDARHPGRVAHSLGRWARMLRDLVRVEGGAEALVTIFRYLSVVAEELTPETIHASLADAAPEVREILMTTLAERWKAEGRIEGKAEGARLVLLSLLELKFGAVDDAERRQIEGATDLDISRWAKRVLTAASIREVLSD